ncbi:MAG: hypothetical protein II011_01350 [Prevotella sp.]|nr:hypothetical protein [Prevotella sp.]
MIVFVKINYSLERQFVRLFFSQRLPVHFCNYQVHFLVSHLLPRSEREEAEQEIHEVVPGEFL